MTTHRVTPMRIIVVLLTLPLIGAAALLAYATHIGAVCW
jgi:hypothetical protein